ncbi:MAG TPA: MG2 domain-containing protein, partial [Candidatus Edwardsbacteria bacterium]|nr:MG2 domain-containing protein [Candidatus Edwardsbacteria bacterium]
MKRNNWCGMTAVAVAVALGALASLAMAAQGNAPLQVLAKTPVGPVAAINQAMDITVTFSQPMAPLEALPEGGGSGPLSIAPPVRGKYRWNGPSTLVFTPRDTLTYATAYTLTVPAGTKSLSGAALAKDETWGFETPRPQLSYSDPGQKQTHVNLSQVIWLYFNQPMDAGRAKPFIKVFTVDAKGAKVPLTMDVRPPTEDEQRRLGRSRTVLALAAVRTLSPGPGFAADDFAEMFWRQLRSPADSVSMFLAAQFSPATVRLLNEYDVRMPADPKLKDAVVGEINRLMRSAQLYTPARFAQVKLNQGTRTLASQSLSGDNLARLNRLLLQKAYDAYLDRVAKMPQERTIRVELAKGLLAARGDLGMAAEYTLEFSTYNYFRFEGAAQKPDADPASPVVFQFSNPVYGKDLLKNITIAPKTGLFGEKHIGFGGGEYDESYYSSYDYTTDQPSFQFDFTPESSYRIVISGKLRDMFGQVLGKDVEVRVTTAGYAPALQIPAGLGVLEAYLPARLPVRVMNWPQVQRRIANIPTDGIVPLLQHGVPNDYPVAAGAGSVNDEWALETRRNALKRLPLELKAVLTPDNTGLVYYNLYGLPPREYSYEHWVDTTQVRSVAGFVQVTNLGLTGKYSPENALLWVTRLKDCQPVAGAAVELRDDDNRVVFTGKTDKRGLCQCPGWEKLGIKPAAADDNGEGDEYYGRRPRVWAIVTKGSDRAVLVSDWGMGISPYEFGLSYDWNPQPVQYQGYLTTERGLYKAGEKVYIKGIVRQKRLGQWQVPGPRSLSLVIKDSRDQELANTAVALSEWGSFGYVLQLKKDAPTGYYSIRASGDSSARMEASESFRVEAYKPATFEVSAAIDRPEYVAGDELSGSVAARYLFGSPMAKEQYSWAMRLAPYDYAPPGHPGYIFSRYWWWDDNRDYGSLLASGEGQLDDQGHAAVSAKLDLHGSKGTMGLTLEGTVTSQDRVALSGRRQAIVHRGEYYIGYLQNTSFVDLGKPLELSVIAAQPDGALLTGRRVDVEIVRQQWISARRAGAGGRYEWYSERQDSTVYTGSVTTGPQPAAVSYTPQRPGFYIVKLQSADGRANEIYNGSYFYAVGDGYVAWEARNDDRIDLVADKESYRPGDVARIMIKSPYVSAKALVTLEREYVISQQVLDLAGSAPTIELPLTAEHLPNVYVSVILLRGRLAEQRYAEDGDDLSKPAFKMGYINLPVDPGSRRLALTVASDKPLYAPRDSVTLEVAARDFQNQPALAEVTLAVVDKGVLNLIDFKTPDAFDAFYGQRPLSVESAETRLHVIGQRSYGEKGENRGGGGGPENSFRGEFLTTPFYTAAVYTDKDGRASARFRLPDNLTAFKVMALAHTKASQFGSADNSFTVSKPIMLLESLPRFLRVGDSLAAGVTVHNRTAVAQEVTVRAEASGVDLLGDAKRVVTVQPNQAQVVNYTFRAKNLGEAKFRFTASAPGGKDGLEQTLPVQLPAITEAVALYEQTETSAQQALQVPERAWPGIGSLEVSASSTAFSGLEACLDYLIKYPYGCLEQTMSGLMPMILAHDLIVNVNLAPAKGKDIHAYVQAGIERVYKFQAKSGGFGLWMDSPREDPYLTAYAMSGLARAKAKGYAVDQTVADLGIAYLQQQLRSVTALDQLDWPYYSQRWKLNTLCYGCYALAQWGHPEAGTMEKLYARRAKLNLFGRAMLLRALKLAGTHPEMQAELAQQLLNAVKVSPTKWHFEDAADETDCWVFYDNTISTAFILSTLLEAKGEFPGAEKVVTWLLEERKIGRWRSTHENIHVFTALDDYLTIYEKDTPDFTASVKVGGKEILREIFKGRQLDTRSKQFALSEFTPGRQLPVDIAKDGAGRLYYGLRMVYAPLDPVKVRNEGLSVSKKITTISGDSAVTQFQAGQVYKVTLTVTSTQDRHYVVVDDPLPAGCEAVNESFATESNELLRRAHRSADT